MERAIWKLTLNGIFIGIVLIQHSLALACTSPKPGDLSPRLREITSVKALFDYLDDLGPISDLSLKSKGFLSQRESMLQRYMLWQGQSKLWFLAELALGGLYALPNVVFRRLYTERYLNRILSIVHQLQVLDNTRPDLTEKIPNLDRLRRKINTALVLKDFREVFVYGFILVFHIIVFLGGFLPFLALGAGLDKEHLESLLSNGEDYLEKTASEVNPDTTLIVSPISISAVPTGSTQELSNLFIVYKAVRLFFELHHIEDRRVSEVVQHVSTPGDICKAIDEWDGDSPIEILIIITHGNENSELQFRGVDRPVSAKLLAQMLDSSPDCQGDYKNKLASKVNVLFFACALAQTSKNSSHSLELASVISENLVPVDEIEVVMSRSSLYLEYDEQLVNDATQEYYGLPLLEYFVHQYHHEQVDRSLDALVESIYTPPFMQLYQDYRDLSDIGNMPVHPESDQPQIYKFNN
jgi:hypothetical protein